MDREKLDILLAIFEGKEKQTFYLLSAFSIQPLPS